MRSHGDIAADGRSTALWLSTIAFTVCFAVWTIFAIIGVQIKRELGLNETQFGLLVGTPILTGSLIRLVLGIWTDQYGGRRIYTLVMLSAAVATWLLTYAATYPQFLAAALGVGIAGGSFAVGVAYVSRWYPSDKQGTALGIFGAGNVGAAVTKFCAPFVMVAYGWQTAAQVWAVAIALMGVIFWLTTKEDPALLEQRAKGIRPRTMRQELEPLKNVQVWRFSLYYFYSFGAFVALSLWLPRYLIGVYGVDIETAGMLGAAFSIPASIFRAYGGHLSDKFGARRIMYWTFIVSLLITFVLAYPPTEYAVKGIQGPMRFTMETGVGTFTVLIFVLGFFMSLGKAAVYKLIPDYYPKNVGSVGGLVGMIGGLGGFVLPITFGVLNDLTGIWTSCFMLLFLFVAIALAWFHFSIQHMEHEAAAAVLENLPELPELHYVHRDSRAVARLIQDWRPEDPVFWKDKGRAIARRNLWVSIPALLLAFAIWMVWSVVVAKLPAVGFKFTTDQLFWLAAMPGLSGATLRIFLLFHAADLRWPLMDLDRDLVADDPGGRHRARGAEHRHALHLLFDVGAPVRLRRRQLRLVDGQHLVLLPQGGEGQRARPQCGLGKSRRQRRPVRHSAGHHSRRVRLDRRRRADHGGRDDEAVAAECRLYLGAVHRRLRLRRLVRHERHRHHEGVLRRSGGDLPEKAQLDHVLALHRHLRLVHRLFRRLPAASPRPNFPTSIRSNSPSSARWSAPSRARRPAGCPTAGAAVASPSGCSR